jgi:orotate phosphoribosyltransferase
MNNINYSTELAHYLLAIEAVKLSPSKPFTWASGWRSPIYCDNRLTLSYPLIRKLIIDGLADIVANNYPLTTAIAGVATAGIAHGALLADRLNLPFIYVRSTPKNHGMTNLIEGKADTSLNYLVVEDLVSTGKSSVQVIDALRNAGCNVLGLAALFTYQFDAAKQLFDEKNCPYTTITNYTTLLDIALNKNYITAEYMDTLAAWRAAPSEWMQ